MVLLDSPALYPDLLSELDRNYTEEEKKQELRWLCRNDLYFISRYVLGWVAAEHPWIFARHREVQAKPDGMLDLWAREHGKSSIITMANSIKDILKTHGDGAEGEEVTIGIFSHTRPIAKSFLAKIKRELGGNQILLELFPDILFEQTGKAPKWSDEAIIVKRRSNPPEATVEAWGLVDAQPVGRHFNLLIYDDVVTLKSVSTPEQIKRTTDALALSYNLGKIGGRRRMIGTRYHHNDTYREVIERGTFTPRIYPCTEDGTVDGKPVLLDPKTIAEKYIDQGPYIFSAQMLLNPTAEGNQGFQTAWLRRWQPKNWNNLNIYITVDPAHSKKKGSDNTVIWVIGLGQDQNYYLIDGIRDQLNLSERTQALFDLHRKYRPISVGYERFGMQADIQHIEERQVQLNYRFNIIELAHIQGLVTKHDRIKQLQPVFAAGRFYLPVALNKITTALGVRNIIDDFINQEYIPFPVPVFDDGFDCMARILDPNLDALFPSAEAEEVWEPDEEADY